MWIPADLRQLINCYWMHENLHTFWSLVDHDGGSCAIFATVTRRLSWEEFSGTVWKKLQRKHYRTHLEETIFPAAGSFWPGVTIGAFGGLNSDGCTMYIEINRQHAGMQLWRHIGIGRWQHRAKLREFSDNRREFETCASAHKARRVWHWHWYNTDQIHRA